MTTHLAGNDPHENGGSADTLAPRPWWLLALAPILVWNASAGPHVFDAGELVASAWQLGASHPPGQPMHALLGHAATWIPVGPIHFRVALLSVATELIAAYLVARLTHDLIRAHRVADSRGEASTTRPIAATPTGSTSATGDASATSSTSDTTASTETIETTRTSPAKAVDASYAGRIAPHVAALGALLSPPLLAQATRVEVYGLALVFSLASMRALVAWWLAPRVRSLVVGAFAAGLAATVHPPHGLALVALGLVLALARWRNLGVRALLVAACGFLVAALGLVHLPLRALAGAPMWGEPTTWATFIDYITARAYAQNVGVASDHALWEQTGAVVLFLASLAPVALLSALVARRWVLLIGVLSMSSAAMLQPLDDAIPDMVAYLGPALVFLVALGAASLARLPLRHSLALVGMLALALPGLALPRVLDDLDAHHPELETLAAIYLESPTPRSVVVTDTDFVAAAWMEAQAVEGARPDALLVISGLITSSWHWETFARHPLFDGSPVRGPGDDPRDAYLLGVGIRAKDRVDLVSELDRWGLLGARGPYAQSKPAIRVGRDWLPKLAVDAWPVEGDGAVAAVVRHAVARHALRLAERGHPAVAWTAWSWIEGATVLPGASERGPLPVWIDDSRTFLVGAADARRVTSVLLVRGGRLEDATSRLRRDPDPLAAVQIAANWAAVGRRSEARVMLNEHDAGVWRGRLGL